MGLRRRDGVEAGDELSERRFLAAGLVTFGVGGVPVELDSDGFAIALMTVSMSLHLSVRSIRDSYIQFK